jgi:nicotinamidase-related amidase
VPERGQRTALLVVDMLNSYEHDDAEQLAESVRHAVPQIAGLIERARREDAPVVYSSSEELAREAMDGRHPELVEPLLPRDDDAFVIKARHSVFYSTPLEYLLQTMDVGRIVLTGQATEQCILYSALDAYVRHFRVVVPRDAVAHIHAHLADAAMEMLQTNMRAEITTAERCRL